jgi:hypothetical protein
MTHYLREQVFGFGEAKRNMPTAVYKLLRSGSMSTPQQTKYIPKPQAKYLDELIKRGWMEYVDKGGFYEGVRTTKAGREAMSQEIW